MLLVVCSNWWGMVAHGVQELLEHASWWGMVASGA